MTRERAARQDRPNADTRTPSIDSLPLRSPTSQPPKYDDPVTVAARIVDYAAARQAILARLPDDVLAVIAFLACDDAVTAAYDELARRQS